MAKKYKNLTEFKAKNAKLFSQTIVKSFFENEPSNNILLEASVIRGEDEATKRLDCRFVEHFYKYRLVKYISTLSYFFSNDYDKHRRKQRERFLLLLDQPSRGIEEDVNSTMLDHLMFQKHTTNNDIEDCLFEGQTVFEMVGDEKLYKSLMKLNKKEQEIIQLIVIEQMKQAEVAKLFDESPQSISKKKKVALDKIKKAYKNRRG